MSDFIISSNSYGLSCSFPFQLQVEPYVQEVQLKSDP